MKTVTITITAEVPDDTEADQIDRVARDAFVQVEDPSDDLDVETLRPWVDVRVGRTPQLAMTFGNDAWEWLYGELVRLVEVGATVAINPQGTDESSYESVELIGLEGGSGFTVGSQLLVSHDDGYHTRIPMFTDNGDCAITRVHVF